MKSNYIKWGIGAFAAGFAVVLLDALFLEKYFFQIKRIHIGRKDSNQKIKILLLSDLHFVHRFRSFHRRLAKKVDDIRPDLILLTGDTIDQNGEVGPAKQFFSLLNPSIPKIAIPGNHDHKNEVSIGTLKRILERHNGQLLMNETIQLRVRNTSFTITGLDDFIEGEGRFREAVKYTKREDHHLLLVHSPLQQEGVLAKLKSINGERATDDQLLIQYIFAGHNHGGQVRLGSFVPVLPEKSGNYVDGWYHDAFPKLYVSKGFGTSGVPFRFGARSEVTLFYYGV